MLTPFQPVADVWYHLAAAYDAGSGTAQLYVDGEFIEPQPVTELPMAQRYFLF